MRSETGLEKPISSRLSAALTKPLFIRRIKGPSRVPKTEAVFAGNELASFVWTWEAIVFLHGIENYYIADKQSLSGFINAMAQALSLAVFVEDLDFRRRHLRDAQVVHLTTFRLDIPVL
jgi:hypothetical protein